jgi:hypothetical protein
VVIGEASPVPGLEPPVDAPGSLARLQRHGVTYGVAFERDNPVLAHDGGLSLVMGLSSRTSVISTTLLRAPRSHIPGNRPP